MERKYGSSILKSYINKESKGFEITLDQLESMNLPPFLQKALFGRTAEEWRKNEI